VIRFKICKTYNFGLSCLKLGKVRFYVKQRGFLWMILFLIPWWILSVVDGGTLWNNSEFGKIWLRA